MRLVKNVALVGLPLCGKTAVGKKLAKAVGARFFDTDGLVETEFKTTVSEIFEKRGEIFFRTAEEKTLNCAANQKNAVISTGGGAVESEKNREILKNCCVIYLYATPKALAKRAKTQTRPLLKGNTEQKLSELYERRKRLYQEVCDIKLSVGAISPEKAAEIIFQTLSDLEIIVC